MMEPKVRNGLQNVTVVTGFALTMVFSLMSVIVFTTELNAQQAIGSDVFLLEEGVPNKFSRTQES
ncbi:MAG: hypothetical protein ACRD4J_09900 [Nitrososphaeraceae archaeon]